MRIYLAGALFTLAERNFNLDLANHLKALDNTVEVILPQASDKLFAGRENFEQLIFDYCRDEVIKADIIVAVLEGPDIDSGTCVELGIAYAHKKKIIGIRTDFRGSETEGLNIMVRKVIDHYLYFPNGYPSVAELAGSINQLLNG